MKKFLKIKMNKNKNYAIGIDLGTTYSCVGVWMNGSVKILKNKLGDKTTTPSIVSFTKEKVLIGEEAKNILTTNSENTIYDVKRLIGRQFKDDIVQKDIVNWPFKVEKDEKSNRPVIIINFLNEKKVFYPEDISAILLKHMKKLSEEYLDCEVKDAVITVPAYFDEKQRQATKDAGSIAGLNVLRIINEPTAAALAYGLQNKLTENKKVLVFDLGGGTFDVSILDLTEGSFEVIATRGDTHFGGGDFDNNLMNYCIDQLKSDYGIDITNNSKAKLRLKNYCEKAKIELSSALETIIYIEKIYNEKDLQLTITRDKFEKLCEKDFNKCIPCVEETLKDAKLTKEKIDEIILVGGSTRIPKIQEILKKYFNKELNKSIHPDEAVAYGAAYQAASITDNLDDGLEKLILIDVTPLSLGIAELGEIMVPLIKRNTRIPIKATSTDFVTSEDNQESALIQIYQGERTQVKDNIYLGKIIINNIRKADAGEVKFRITFNVDVNGIITVTAEEIDGNNNKKVLPIDEKDREKLSEEEIERRIEELLNLSQMEIERDEAIKEKVKLQGICLKFRKKNKKADEIYQWTKKYPNEKKGRYTEKITELETILKKENLI